MYEAIGHFLLQDQIPCVVLVKSPQPLLNILTAPALTTEAQAAPAATDHPVASAEVGDFDVETVAGRQAVSGVLVPLIGLGLNGQKTALEIVELTKTRHLDASQHAINFDASGAVSGWKLTPRPSTT